MATAGTLDLLHIGLAIAIAALTYYYNSRSATAPGTPGTPGTPGLPAAPGTPSFAGPGGLLAHLLQSANNVHSIATGPIVTAFMKGLLANLGQSVPLQLPAPIVAPLGGPPTPPAPTVPAGHVLVPVPVAAVAQAVVNQAQPQTGGSGSAPALAPGV